MAFSFGTSVSQPPTFGATQTVPTFGFGSTTVTTSGPTFGFGSAKPTTSGFGITTTTSSTGFGGFGSFGTTTSSSGGLFSGLGKPTTTSTGFGTSLSTFGSTANQQQQQQQVRGDNINSMATAVSMPAIYNDERDALIAKWNQVQAFWGTGEGYLSANNAVKFTPENPFCRFKAIGFSCMPTTRNEDGLVGIVFSKNVQEVSSLQTQIVDVLSKLLGNKPTLSVCVDGVKPLPDNQTELIFYIMERQPTGASSRFLATEVYNFFTSANMKTQLQQQLLVANIVPKVGLTSEQLNNYLDNPPAGIDPFLWQQAKLDNPDPGTLIPVPMVGFSELLKRLKHQDKQTHLHQNRLDVISQDISELQRNHGNMVAKTEQYKRKQLDLSHRVLKVMVKQEICRKLGYAIQADEEQLRVNLEAIQAELNAPTQFKGRLNEMMSQIRMQNQMLSGRYEGEFQIDKNLQDEIQQHLKQQQQGLQHLISIMKDDLEDLKVIEHELEENSNKRR